MPIAWFICPYKRRMGMLEPTRYCAADDFTAVIVADGGNWSETEVLGNRAIVKVRASAVVLSAMNAAPGFVRLPKDTLDEPLVDLAPAQETRILDLLLDLGYSPAEIQVRFETGVKGYTLRDVVRFMATRRHKPRYDPGTDAIILDGPVERCRPVEEVDRAI